MGAGSGVLLTPLSGPFAPTLNRGLSPNPCPSRGPNFELTLAGRGVAEGSVVVDFAFHYGIDGGV